MAEHRVSTERVRFFSDGVFAVVITIMVLELKAPESASASAILALWPTGLAYAVSYLFLAIVWVNHHHLLSYAEVATTRLIWMNFAHLFPTSLVPFATAWIANTRLAPVPVAVYAGVFVLVNLTYVLLCREVVDRRRARDVPARARRMMRMRSFLTMGVFAAAAVVSLRFPVAGLALICCCLTVYLRPEAPTLGA
ncbi:MAG TPA: TMEM175 family protein [Stellaceae bacterium]|nr:TMEM175 family protein [Stellaceae bacterium]